MDSPTKFFLKNYLCGEEGGVAKKRKGKEAEKSHKTKSAQFIQPLYLYPPYTFINLITL